MAPTPSDIIGVQKGKLRICDEMRGDDSSAALLGKYMFGCVRKDTNINSWKNLIFVKNRC